MKACIDRLLRNDRDYYGGASGIVAGHSASTIRGRASVVLADINEQGLREAEGG